MRYPLMSQVYPKIKIYIVPKYVKSLNQHLNIKNQPLSLIILKNYAGNRLAIITPLFKKVG